MEEIIAKIKTKVDRKSRFQKDSLFNFGIQFRSSKTRAIPLLLKIGIEIKLKLLKPLSSLKVGVLVSTPILGCGKMR